MGSGTIAVLVGTVIVTTLRDAPEDRGFPPVELETTSAVTQADDVEDAKPSLIENLLHNVLSNPFIWGLAFTYFCVYACATGYHFVVYLLLNQGERGDRRWRGCSSCVRS